MHVRLITDLSFVAGVRRTGDVVELPEAQGLALLDAGLAEAAEAEWVEPPKPEAPESGALGAEAEQAIVPRARKRG